MASSQLLAHGVSHDSDSGDSDAPEQLTLSSAKKTSQTRVEAVRVFEREMKEKRKRERKEREEERRRVEEERREAGEEEEEGGRKRKRARGNVGRGKEINGDEESMEMENVKRRMERAMRDAEAEEAGDDDVDDDENKDGSEDDEINEDESESSENSDNVDHTDDSDNVEEEWGGITEEDVTKPPSAKTKHLPDHIFSAAAAAAAHTARSTSKQASKSAPSSSQKHKDKRKKSKAKDILVGYVHSHHRRRIALKQHQSFKTPLPALAPSAWLLSPYLRPPLTHPSQHRSHSPLHGSTSSSNVPYISNKTTSQAITIIHKRKITNQKRRVGRGALVRFTHNSPKYHLSYQLTLLYTILCDTVQIGVMRHTTGPAMRFVRNGDAAGR